MNKVEFSLLMQKISDGTADDQDIALYNRYFHAYQQAGSDWNVDEMGDQQIIYAKLKQRIEQEIKPALIIPIWRRSLKIVAAAVILIALSTGLYFFVNTRHDSLEELAKHVIPAGKNKAFLKLADGSTINLSDANKGRLAQQAGVVITKNSDGQIVYTVVSEAAGKTTDQPLSNTISTPRGGQFQIDLPDGTKVWLNAASSLTFPAIFDPAKSREVNLSGEAYFEVAHQEKQAFMVKTSKQTVQVLGTHFNINSYDDEEITRTTLLEGSVKVWSSAAAVVIKPGEQAVLTSGRLNTRRVDPGDIVDWKNGEFIFRNENIHTIMRKISRWYDVDIVFQDEDLDKETFSGSVSRYDNVSEILKSLQLTDRVHFKIVEKKIIVMN